MKIQPKTFIASAAVALLASSATGNFFQGTAIGNFLQGGESGTPSPLIEFEATKPAIAGEVNANFEVLEADIWELDFDANLNRIRIASASTGPTTAAHSIQLLHGFHLLEHSEY